MDKHCRICHNTSCSNHGKNISFLGDGWKCNYIPVPTNADHIRSMADEELADFLNQWGISTRAWQKDPGETLYWLQMPAEEADHA